MFSVTRATWSAPTVGPSSPAAPPAGAHSATTSGTWPWRRWPAPWCSPASTAQAAAWSRCFTLRRLSTRRLVSSDLTPAPAREPAASGKAPLNRSVYTWLMCLEQILINLSLQVMAHLMQVHKSITTLQGEDIVFLATDINLPGKERNAKALQFCKKSHYIQNKQFQ